IASNTSPIIALAKIGRLGLVKELYQTVVIPPFVKAECVDRGKELGAPDALEIERAIEEGWIKVIGLTKTQSQAIRRLIDKAKIGFGEAGALILARDGGIPAILDDKEARALAKGWGLEYMGTVMVLYEAFARSLISHDELVEALAKLARAMWIGTDVITDVIKRAKGVRK
ncbi:MAG: hypothetical protein QXL35_06075, partial [Candidatus Bathyarchaeia archaeon]